MELKLCNIVHDFGKKRILNTINLSMSPGVYGLLGPNGTGKTTLMRIVADVLYPTRGNVLLDGQNKDDMGISTGLRLVIYHRNWGCTIIFQLVISCIMLLP